GFKISAGSTCSTLTIKKKDADGNLLGGATFRITPDPTPGSQAAHLDVTDNDSNDSDPADGVIVIDPAAPGDYTITEIGAPEGYLIDNTSGVSVTAPPGGDAPVKTFTDSLGTLTVDKVTQDGTFPADALVGAGWTLTATGGDALDLNAPAVTINDANSGTNSDGNADGQVE